MGTLSVPVPTTGNGVFPGLFLDLRTEAFRELLELLQVLGKIVWKSALRGLVYLGGYLLSECGKLLSIALRLRRIES